MANLFVILTREARKAVVFRRGPSRQVLLLTWDLKKDKLTPGQWLKKRLYEHRCDLSPSGELLAYFAADHGQHRQPFSAWTAISRPPYLTALALWPNRIGTYGGGALFENATTLLLNHDAYSSKLADGFELPKNMRTRAFGDRPGSGGDDAIYHARLRRDGWVLRQVGKEAEYHPKGIAAYPLQPPRIHEKAHTRRKVTCVLQMQLHGLHGRTSHYVLDYELQDDTGAPLLKLTRTDWADWDSNGDLLFAEKGKLFRHPWSGNADWKRTEAKLVADLNDMTFAPKEAPKSMLRWP